MSPLRQALADYLAVRRSLGYKLARPEKLLGQFITYLEDAGADGHHRACAGLGDAARRDPSWHALRLSAVRGFATYLRTIDPAAEVPPADLIPSRPRRATPYLYSDADIAALIAAAASLRFPLRVATYQTLIGLLAVTGMRVGEAIRLDHTDLDLAARRADRARVQVRQVPAAAAAPDHGRGAARLPAAARPAAAPARAPRRCSSPRPAPGCCYCNVQRDVRSSWSAAPGCGPGRRRCRPRIHDLRHTFAVAHPARRLRRRAGRAGPAPAAVHLPRPRRPDRHLLVPARRPRAARRWPGSGSKHHLARSGR